MGLRGLVAMVGVGLLAACGTPKPSRLPLTESPPAVTAPLAAPAAARREASSAIRRRWVHGPAPELALFVDFERLRSEENFQSLLAHAVHGVKASWRSDVEKRCLQAVTAGTRALALGLSDHLRLILLELEPASVELVRSACVGPVIPPEPIVMPASSETYAVAARRPVGPRGTVVAVESNLVLIGARELVEKALSQSEGSRFPEDLGLEGDQGLKFSARSGDDDPLMASGWLTVDEQRLAGQVRLLLADEEAPHRLAEVFRAFTNRSPIGRGKMIGRIVAPENVHIDGRLFTFSFDAPGCSPVDAGDLAGLTHVAVSTPYRRERIQLAVEAREQLNQLAAAYVAHFRERVAKLPPKQRRLFSLPAVPAAIPEGHQTYRSTPADWQAWRPLELALLEPQHYQFEVVAAQDGMSANIIGRADFGADGVVSEVRLRLQLDPKTRQLVDDGQLVKNDPTE